MTQPTGRSGPISGQTAQVAAATASPTDVRTGTVVGVTSRGINVSVAGGLVDSVAHLDSYNPAVGEPVLLLRFQDSWTVLGRPVGPGTGGDLTTPGSGAGTTLLGGTVLYGSGTTIATSTGAAVVVPRMAASYHHPANHWVMIMAGFNWYNNVVNDWTSININNVQSGGAVGGVELIQAGNNFYGQFQTLAFLVPPSYGGVRRDLYMSLQRANGTGTVRIDDSSLRRNYLLVFDAGDGSVISTA